MIVAVVNADDFGLSVSINAGIRDAMRTRHSAQRGLMANGEGFDDAVSRVKNIPVSGWGFICRSSAKGPSRRLTNSAVSLTAGRLPPSYADFARGYLSRRFTPREVAPGNGAQIVHVLRAGIRPTHLDSHQHVHLMPGVFDLTLDLAEAYKIRVVRIPHVARFFTGACFGTRSPAWGPGFPERTR
jgi:predicted glycoside hydrolase/deacetylase ChbG (UPF0249 family)